MVASSEASMLVAIIPFIGGGLLFLVVFIQTYPEIVNWVSFILAVGNAL